MELPMFELAVVGAKDSGKTTVIEKLANYLIGKGYQVATIKHTSHFHRFDTPGKDSYRHRQAGAKLTIVMSEEEVAVFAQPDSLNIGKLQDICGRYFDAWLVEGDMRSDRPKILITRYMDDLPRQLPGNIVATMGPKRINDVPMHFDDGDYNGLGFYIVNTMLEQKTEAHK
jgi:molybdopterin-guanine dinucleotide biosynthesis protein B